jgi:hypothetical protein
VQHQEGAEFAQHINKERKPAKYVGLLAWQFEKLHVSANIT